MDVERSCRSKQVYLTKAHAKAISRSMSARHREALHLYACAYCNYWHIGHMNWPELQTRAVPSWERRAVRVA